MSADKRKRFLCCLLSVFAWGFAAHGFAFFNHFPSHDALTEMNGEKYGHAWKIALGRVFVPAYHSLTRGGITLPLVIGILSLFYISIALYLITLLFDLKKNVFIILAAGILTTNLTVMANVATYLNDLDCNMFAMLMAVTAIVLLDRSKRGFLYGMLPLCISLGIYQSYVSVALTLFLMLLIFRLLKGEAKEKVFAFFRNGIILFAGGGVLYILSLKLVPFFCGIALDQESPNSMGALKQLSFSGLLRDALAGFGKCGYELLLSDHVYPMWLRLTLHLAIYGAAAFFMIGLIRKNKIPAIRIVLVAVCFLLMPFAMNVSYILQGGNGHDLMFYAFWLAEVFVLILAAESDVLPDPKKMRKALVRYPLIFCCIILLWGNVRTSNTLYLKKKIEYDANLSFFTGLLTKMQACEGYEEYSTPVAFLEIRSMPCRVRRSLTVSTGSRGPGVPTRR